MHRRYKLAATKEFTESFLANPKCRFKRAFNKALSEDEERRQTFQVISGGERLDVWLAHSAGLSRNQVQKLISEGNVRLDGVATIARAKLKAGQSVELHLPQPEVLSLEPENIPLHIVYQDSELIIINKQRGLVVHPAAGNWTGTLVQALLYHCQDFGAIAGTIRPGIVHRLDKDTTGLLVVAKNDAALQDLARQIKERVMERCYLALVWGGFNEDQGTINLPIGRHPRERKRMAVTASGRAAQTDYQVVQRLGQWTLLRLKLHSGRTHQIRVHLSHLGHPVVGDPTYSPRSNPFGLRAQALHAYRLCLEHPRSKERCCWEADLPEDFAHALAVLQQRHHL